MDIPVLIGTYWVYRFYWFFFYFSSSVYSWRVTTAMWGTGGSAGWGVGNFYPLGPYGNRIQRRKVSHLHQVKYHCQTNLHKFWSVIGTINTYSTVTGEMAVFSHLLLSHGRGKITPKWSCMVNCPPCVEYFLLTQRRRS